MSEPTITLNLPGRQIRNLTPEQIEALRRLLSVPQPKVQDQPQNPDWSKVG